MTDKITAIGRSCLLVVLAVVTLPVLSACTASSRRSPQLSAALQQDARLLAMLDTRMRDTSLIDEMLRSDVSSARSRAAVAVGRVKIDSRYDELRKLLVDADTAVAANAAFALGLARDSGSIIQLGRALAGAPDVVAVEAAWALGMIGEPARTVVSVALGEATPNPLATSTAAQRSAEVRAELLLAVARIRGINTTVLLPWLSDSNSNVVGAAAYSLSRARVARGVRPMLALSKHSDEQVRQYVARMLDRAAAGDSLAARAQEVLKDMLNDQSERVRINAVRSLMSYGSSVKENLPTILRDGAANVRIAALDNIVPVVDKDVVLWRSAWDADTSFVFRSGLMQAAARAGTDALAGYEVVWQKNSEWRYRRAVASVPVRGTVTNGEQRIATLRWALNDTDGRVRSAAYAALFMGPQAVTDSLIRLAALAALNDNDIQVRVSAASAVGRFGDATSVAHLLDSYDRALNDIDGDARNATIRAIASVWNRDSSRFSTDNKQRLAQLKVPSDPIDRAAAASLTPMSSWNEQGSSRIARSTAEYERIAQQYLSPNAANVYVTMRTDRGDIRLILHAKDAPMTVDSFLSLVRRGFYKDTRFHRVVPNFVAQDGDPRGDGTGGGGFYLRDEHSRVRHARGCLGVATSGPETGGSQFYMCHSPQPHLDGGYTVFGTIVSGLEVLDKIVQGDRIRIIEAR